MNGSEARHVLGFEEMDVQHQYLYGLFDSIEYSSEVEDMEKMRFVLQEIERYLNFHCSSEEHLMRLYDAPFFSVHQSDHEAVATKFIQYMDDFDAGRLNPASLRIFLTGWLMEHSRTSDSQYVKYIQDYRQNLGK
jgi:hemerythrin-like metal-binding protein